MREAREGQIEGVMQDGVKWRKVVMFVTRPSVIRWFFLRTVCVCVFYSAACVAGYTKHCHVYIFSFKPVNFPLYPTCFLLGLWAEGLWMQEREEPVCICVHWCMHSYVTFIQWVYVWVWVSYELWHAHTQQWQSVWCRLHQVLQECFLSLSCLSQSVINDGRWRTTPPPPPPPHGKMQYPCETSLLEASGSVLLIN